MNNERELLQRWLIQAPPIIELFTKLDIELAPKLSVLDFDNAEATYPVLDRHIKQNITGKRILATRLHFNFSLVKGNGTPSRSLCDIRRRAGWPSTFLTETSFVH